jgi:hypothetical protein
MRSLLKACGVLAVASLAAMPAFAAEPPEPPITNPTQVIDNATVDNMKELLTELGAQQIEVQEGQGMTFLRFRDGDVPYNVGITLCNVRPGKCLAITFMVIVDPGATAYSLEALNAFNRDSLFVTLVKLDGNKFGAGRILLIDGGVTKKNLAINLGSFALTFRAALQYLSGQVVAGFEPPRGHIQRLDYRAPPRAVRATPQELVRLMNTMSKQYQTTLRPRR